MSTLAPVQVGRNADVAPLFSVAESFKSGSLNPFIQKDPGYAALHRLSLLREVRRYYGDLRNLNLPPDQLTRLNNLLVNKTTAPADARDAALQQGIKENTPEFYAAVNKVSADADNEIKSFLGPSGYQLLMADGTAAGEQLFMYDSPMERDLASAGIPLSGEQTGALMDTLQKIQSTPQAARDPALIARAAAVLTPEQLEVFKQTIAFQSESNELVQRAMKAAQQQDPSITSWSWGQP